MLAVAPLPVAVLPNPLAVLNAPIAVLLSLLAVLPAPNAELLKAPVAAAVSPQAVFDASPLSLPAGLVPTPPFVHSTASARSGASAAQTTTISKPVSSPETLAHGSPQDPRAE
ncbi:MAG: hypothetical protein R3D01_03210 [Hyphomicrobiales bacterium]